MAYFQVKRNRIQRDIAERAGSFHTRHMSDGHWLTNDNTLRIIADLCAITDGPHVSAKRLMKLREQFSAEQVRFIASQVNLRLRAITRFPQAAKMLFTDRGLQQTTDAAIATCKSALIQQFAPGVQHVTDLCCGIGGDLQALAARFNVRGVDLTPEMCAIAQHNAGLSGRNRVETVIGNAATFPLETDWVHIDPDRRHDGLRHTDVHSLEPGVEILDSLINRVGDTLQGVSIKLAPATTVPHDWHSRGSLYWIESRNECRQQLVVFSNNNHTQNSRTALGVDQTGKVCWEFTTPAGQLVEAKNIPLTSSPVRFLLEPKPAILAGKLAPTWAARHNLKYIHSAVSYFSADAEKEIPGGDCYRIYEQLPFDLKQLKHRLQQLAIGRLEIKKRGIDITPEEVRKKLKLRGTNAATLIIAGTPRSRKPAVAYLAERA